MQPKVLKPVRVLFRQKDMTSVLAVRQKTWMVFFIGTGDGQLIKVSMKYNIWIRTKRPLQLAGDRVCHLIKHFAELRCHSSKNALKSLHSNFNLEPQYDCDVFKCSKLTFYLDLLLARTKPCPCITDNDQPASPFVISTSPSHQLLPSFYCPQTIIGILKSVDTPL